MGRSKLSRQNKSSRSFNAPLGSRPVSQFVQFLLIVGAVWKACVHTGLRTTIFTFIIIGPAWHILCVNFVQNRIILSSFPNSRLGLVPPPVYIYKYIYISNRTYACISLSIYIYIYVYIWSGVRLWVTIVRPGARCHCLMSVNRGRLGVHYLPTMQITTSSWWKYQEREWYFLAVNSQTFWSNRGWRRICIYIYMYMYDRADTSGMRKRKSRVTFWWIASFLTTFVFSRHHFWAPLPRNFR